MKINDIFNNLKKMSFRKLLIIIFWLLTMIWLIILVVLFVAWAAVIKQSTPVGTWNYDYTDNLKKYLTDKEHSKDVQSQIKLPDQIDVTKSVRDNQEAIPSVKTLADLLKYEKANLKYDITGKKAPEDNKIKIENKEIIIWELKNWPVIYTDKAQFAQNVQAAMALIFVVILSGAIFTTVLFAVKKNNKKDVNNG